MAQSTANIIQMKLESSELFSFFSTNILYLLHTISDRTEDYIQMIRQACSGSSSAKQLKG